MILRLGGGGGGGVEKHALAETFSMMLPINR